MAPTSDLASQFADILQQGNPDFAKSLGEALSAGGGVLSDGADPTATKADANYQSQSDSEEKCSNCTHFDGKSSCDVVSGTISPDGISDYYEPSQAKSSTGDGGSNGSPAGSDGASSGVAGNTSQ